MQRSFHRIALLAGVIAGLAAGQANADAIVSSATRIVEADVTTSAFGLSDVATSGPFVHSISRSAFLPPPDADANAFADQDSSIGVLVFQGTGNANTDGSTVGGNPNVAAKARSIYEVFFDLGVSHFFSLSVSLGEVVDGGSAEARFFLSGPGGALFDVSPVGGTLPLLGAGTLDPGSYHLLVGATSSGAADTNYFDRASWDFNLTLREVPAPAGYLLLGAGLFAMGVVRRTRAF